MAGKNISLSKDCLPPSVLGALPISIQHAPARRVGANVDDCHGFTLYVMHGCTHIQRLRQVPAKLPAHSRFVEEGGLTRRKVACWVSRVVCSDYEVATQQFHRGDVLRKLNDRTPVVKIERSLVVERLGLTTLGEQLSKLLNVDAAIDYWHRIEA